VAVQRAELGVAGVGVRVEVDHRDAAPADVPRHPGRVGQRNRVVAAQDHRDGAAGTRLEHGFLEPPQGQLGVARRHLHVTGIGDAEFHQRVDAQREVRAGAVVRQVIGEPDRLRAEPGTGPVRGSPVKRRPDDHDVGAGPPGRIRQICPWHAKKRGIGSVHAA
jgi:hypothetical protein